MAESTRLLVAEAKQVAHRLTQVLDKIEAEILVAADELGNGGEQDDARK